MMISFPNSSLIATYLMFYIHNTIFCPIAISALAVAITKSIIVQLDTLELAIGQAIAT